MMLFGATQTWGCLFRCRYSYTEAKGYTLSKGRDSSQRIQIPWLDKHGQGLSCSQSITLVGSRFNYVWDLD